MHVTNPTLLLDREQLRSITLDDPELMREILLALIDDTAKQIAPLETAIQARDRESIARLAHYSKGACANVGANSTATLLKQIERRAIAGDFNECAASLAALSNELNRLRTEKAT